jgi:hypothetical protein
MEVFDGMAAVSPGRGDGDFLPEDDDEDRWALTLTRDDLIAMAREGDPPIDVRALYDRPAWVSQGTFLVRRVSVSGVFSSIPEPLANRSLGSWMEPSRAG